MARFTLTMSLDDDAAVTDRAGTVAHALKTAAASYGFGSKGGKIRDVNGNVIGDWHATDD
jgi:hypothetical protein